MNFNLAFLYNYFNISKIMSDIYYFKTLLGHNGLEFSIICLRSFITNSEQEIRLQIFEDGTLTVDDKEHLISALPNSIIVDKGVRDKIVLEKLIDYPKCLLYRSSTIYTQKLFDIMFYDNSDVCYIDSDIFFIKKFRLPEFDQVPAFMEDTHNAYSFHPLDFWQLKFPIFPYLNSGFFYFPRQWYNLNYIEELLNNAIIFKGITKNISWLEQTLWAFLATKTGKLNYFNDHKIVMAQQVMKPPILDKITEDTIAVHLVYSLRDWVFDLLKTLPSPLNDGKPYQQIKLEPAKNHLNKIQFTSEWLRKKWHRITNKGHYGKNTFLTKKIRKN